MTTLLNQEDMDMRTDIDFTPFRHSTVGFDRLFDLLESGLPGDGTVAGFDTGADGLQEASDGVELWLQVTRRAVDEGCQIPFHTKGVGLAAAGRPHPLPASLR